jgi:hypothetical protein
VRHEGRAQDDGYRSSLVPGLRAFADARRLAEEIAFSCGRLLVLAAEPPGLYGEVRALAGEDLEQATWACFLIAYLSPLEQGDQFAGIRAALEASGAGPPVAIAGHPPARALPELDEIPLGPRTSHDRARGGETLLAYWQWAEHAGQAGVGQAQSPGARAEPAASGPLAARAGVQALAFRGDGSWSPERRFERLFERLALPGFARMGRYELLVTLGRLGLYELRPDSLHLAAIRGLSSDLTTLAAKRVFAIGDPLLLERRAQALAGEISVPVEALDLALANWNSPQRATLGVRADTTDEGALERAERALGL